MPRYNEVYISQQDFEISLHNGMRYDGFVEGMGYAYTSHFSIPPVHFQKHNPPGRVHNDESFFQNGFIQYIDSSPQMRLMSVKYVHKVKSGDTLTSIAQQYGVSIQAVKDVNSNINWAGERKGDRILAGEELKLPNEVKEDFADSSKSKGARSGNPLIGPTVARANFEQRLSKSLYGGGAAQGGGGNWDDGVSFSVSGAYASPFKSTGSRGFSFGFFRGAEDGGFYFTAKKGKGVMMSLSLDGSYYINNSSSNLKFKHMFGHGAEWDVGYQSVGGAFSAGTSIHGTPYYGITGSYSPGLDYGGAEWNTYTVPILIKGTGGIYPVFNFLMIKSAFQKIF